MNLTGLTDTEIWSLFKKGDNRAFSYIYSENTEKLYRYGLKFTSEITLVEDAIQELFADLIKNRKTLGDTDNILYYLLKSFKRKLLRKIQTENHYEHNKDAAAYNFEVTWSVEHDLILEEEASQKSKMLETALKELSPRQKEAIYLRYTRELDYNVVAGLMDISVEACRNLISKAITVLKKKIKKQ